MGLLSNLDEFNVEKGGLRVFCLTVGPRGHAREEVGWGVWPTPRKQLALADCWAQLSTATFLGQSNIGLSQEELGDFRPRAHVQRDGIWGICCLDSYPL